MNMKSNIPPFYPGEEIVCIESHNLGYVTKGESYRALQCAQHTCGCWSVDVGLPGDNSNNTYCRIHGPFHKIPIGGGKWIGARRFVSKHKRNFPLMTFEKIKENEKEEILINN